MISLSWDLERQYLTVWAAVQSMRPGDIWYHRNGFFIYLVEVLEWGWSREEDVEEEFSKVYKLRVKGHNTVHDYSPYKLLDHSQRFVEHLKSKTELDPLRIWEFDMSDWIRSVHRRNNYQLMFITNIGLSVPTYEGR